MKIKEITALGLVVAIYVAISLILAPISYGAIQFRIAELFMILPFYNKKFTISLTLGCFIVNLFSPLGVADIIFGTLSTVVACLIISRVKRIWTVPVISAAIIGIFVGAELYFVLGLPFWFSVATVALGELVSVFIGVGAFQLLLKNEQIKSFIIS